MLVKVAYPEFILDSKKLDNYYDNFSVKERDSYSQMVEKLLRWEIVFDLKRLLEPVDRTEFDFSPAEVNAFNEPESNAIGLPAAVLQAPFFHQSFPRAINYGGLGATIGHEITHGFDDLGKQFDAFGNLRDWWNANTTQKFGNEHSVSSINMGGLRFVPGTALNLNGKLTQGENIADNGGLKLAYKAYKKYLEVHGREKRIKGLEEYDNDKMFFIGYATSSCGHSTQDQLIDQILTDPHSPNRYR
ncbi:peptidase family M13 [Cooperia oncophora]